MPERDFERFLTGISYGFAGEIFKESLGEISKRMSEEILGEISVELLGGILGQISDEILEYFF